MVTFDEYVKSILNQIYDSYKTISSLKDKPGDLEKIKVEWLKINGLLTVLTNKLSLSKKLSDDLSSLLLSSTHYLENYDFEREISIMAGLYSDDSDRLKNLRLKVIESLQDKKLMEKIESIINES